MVGLLEFSDGERDLDLNLCPRFDVYRFFLTNGVELLIGAGDFDLCTCEGDGDDDELNLCGGNFCMCSGDSCIKSAI